MINLHLSYTFIVLYNIICLSYFITYDIYTVAYPCGEGVGGFNRKTSLKFDSCLLNTVKIYIHQYRGYFKRRDDLKSTSSDN